MATRSSFSCTKCGHDQFEADEIRATGKYSRFFDVQNKKFTALCCLNCGYTEIYRTESRGLGNVLDFFTR